MNSGMRGNVSTYHLNIQDVAKIMTEGILPPPAWILAAVIGVTFITPKGKAEATMPDFLRVRRKRVHRKRVHDALLCCKRINPLYRDVEISESNLAQLPEDGIPDELSSTAKVSNDMEMVVSEHEGYVPQDEGRFCCFHF